MRKVGKQKLTWTGCMWCKYQTANALQLIDHFQREHKKETMAGENRPPIKLPDGRWQCIACIEKFITSEGLEHHTITNHQKKML